MARKFMPTQDKAARKAFGRNTQQAREAYKKAEKKGDVGHSPVLQRKTGELKFQTSCPLFPPAVRWVLLDIETHHFIDRE